MRPFVYPRSPKDPWEPNASRHSKFHAMQVFFIPARKKKMTMKEYCLARQWQTQGHAALELVLGHKLRLGHTLAHGCR